MRTILMESFPARVSHETISFFSGMMHYAVGFIIAIVFFFNFAGCNNKHDSTKIRPHASSANDLYCTYKIDSFINNKKDPYALKKGDGICIYCPGAHNCGLNKTWVEIYTGGIPETTGNEYLLDNSGVSCTNCDNMNKYETF